MRNVLRSLRHLRPAFQRQDCVLISVNVAEEPPCHIGKSCHIHSSAFRFVDHAETNFKNHLFTTTTRPLSTDAAKLTNRGSHLFFALRVLDSGRFETSSSSYVFLHWNLLFRLQKQAKLGLLLSMNEELIMVNLLKAMLAR